VLQGFLFVDGPTTRFLSLDSTEGCRLFVSGQRVISLDGAVHGSSVVGYSFPLRDRYAVRIEYFKVRRIKPEALRTEMAAFIHELIL